MLWQQQLNVRQKVCSSGLRRGLIVTAVVTPADQNTIVDEHITRIEHLQPPGEGSMAFHGVNRATAHILIEGIVPPGATNLCGIGHQDDKNEPAVRWHGDRVSLKRHQR